MKAKPGEHYTHYKNGHTYKVVGIARHSETHEKMVVYEAQYDSPEYGARALWVRPLALFEGKVLHEGKMKPRFTRIHSP